MFNKTKQLSLAHEVSVAVMHRTRDHKVASSMFTCSFLCAYMCIKMSLSCHPCILGPVKKN